MHKKEKSVIVLGKGSLAIKIAQWFLESPDYNLLYIVPVIPEPSWTESFQNWAIRNNVSYIDSGHYKRIPDIEKEAWKTDLAVSVTYDKIIKDWFIKKCNQIINIHNGPLPKYRGVSPINWALKNKESTHGVTIHEITPGIDDGPIISQVIFSIYPAIDEVMDVYKRCLDFGWVLFLQTIPLLDNIKAKKQTEKDAVYYHKNQNNLLGERRNFTRKTSV